MWWEKVIVGAMAIFMLWIMYVGYKIGMVR